MTSNVQAALTSQYLAALATLRETIEKYPDDLWTLAGHASPAWRVAFHTLFFAHFYLQKSQDTFERWKDSRPDYARLSRKFEDARPYTKAQMLEYVQFCQEQVGTALEKMDLAAPECGFPWYKMGKLEHQLVNIRHIQHHAAQLSDRIRAATGTVIEWVGGPFA